MKDQMWIFFSFFSSLFCCCCSSSIHLSPFKCSTAKHDHSIDITRSKAIVLCFLVGIADRGVIGSYTGPVRPVNATEYPFPLKHRSLCRFRVSPAQQTSTDY